MKYLLDTNICIYIIRKKPKKVLEKFKKFNPGEIGISAITLAELEYGVAKSQHPDKNQQALAEFTLPLDVLPFDHNAAQAYGSIRTLLEKKGTPIGSMDLMIAAHAMSLNTTLITNNVREFERVKGINIENWY